MVVVVVVSEVLNVNNFNFVVVSLGSGVWVVDVVLVEVVDSS